ncbi:MAG: hypothetical protein HS115_17675 [Spirochaetales bacterium]|nr:hypothetical protein [Spirochaetales bacterium]
MNINKAVDKAFENKSLKEIADAPISALQGITEEGAQKIADALHIKNSIRALATSKYIDWARAIVMLADTEN